MEFLRMLAIALAAGSALLLFLFHAEKRRSASAIQASSTAVNRSSSICASSRSASRSRSTAESLRACFARVCHQFASPSCCVPFELVLLIRGTRPYREPRLDSLARMAPFERGVTDTQTGPPQSGEDSGCDYILKPFRFFTHPLTKKPHRATSCPLQYFKCLGQID